MPTEPATTPLIRKLAADHGVSLAAIAGTGAGGRIRKEDVLAASSAAGEQVATIVDTVNAAVNEGRITEAQRGHWVSLLSQDPGMGAMLAAIKPCDDLAEPVGWFG